MKKISNLGKNKIFHKYSVGFKRLQNSFTTTEPKTKTIKNITWYNNCEEPKKFFKAGKAQD